MLSTRDTDCNRTLLNMYDPVRVREVAPCARSSQSQTKTLSPTVKLPVSPPVPPIILFLTLVPAVSSVVCAVYVVLFHGMLSDITGLIHDMNRTEISQGVSQLLTLERCALNILPGCG